MKKISIALFVSLLIMFGCARVRVEAPKEPIKLDVSMRIDVYQHVQKDIDAIEDIVSGSAGQSAASGPQSRLQFFTGIAYAEEELDPSVKDAALRRKDRLPALQAAMQQGIIGENKSGLVTVVNQAAADASVQSLVNEENNDRMMIYQALAAKNNTSVADIQSVYASRLHNDAPSGAFIEARTGSGSFEWKRK